MICGSSEHIQLGFKQCLDFIQQDHPEINGKTEAKFNKNFGGTLTIVSPFHSEFDLKPEMDESDKSDELELANFKGICYQKNKENSNEKFNGFTN